jgi:ribonuclease HI
MGPDGGPIAILHLDESCLGNGLEGPTPGGSAGLIETRVRGAIERRDFFISESDTTNNRMALSGAITALRILGRKGARMRALMVSDSQYLVKGMREWVPAWAERGWKRKGGSIENLELWRALAEAAAAHAVQWTWVRGHRGHPKNEYANDLALRAARRGESSAGAVASGFPAWLAARQAQGLYQGYDPDAAFTALERRIAAGERIPLGG